MIANLLPILPWLMATVLVAVACSQAPSADSQRVAQLEATIQALQRAPTPPTIATPEFTPTDVIDERIDPSNEHLAAARDYSQSGSSGLALIELDQAIAIWPENQAAAALRVQVANFATSQIQIAQRVAGTQTVEGMRAATATRNEVARVSAATQAAATRVFVNRPLLRSRHQDFSWSRRSGFVTAEGQVTNISDQPIRRVTVVVSFYTADGTFVKSTDAVISYDPILPGQTSPWRATTSDNPAMRTARIDYKELLGGSIRWESVD